MLDDDVKDDDSTTKSTVSIAFPCRCAISGPHLNTASSENSTDANQVIPIHQLQSFSFRLPTSNFYQYGARQFQYIALGDSFSRKRNQSFGQLNFLPITSLSHTEDQTPTEKQWQCTYGGESQRRRRGAKTGQRRIPDKLGDERTGET